MDTLTITEDLIEAGLAVGVAKKQAHILGDFFGKLSTKEGVEKEIGDMRKDMVNMECNSTDHCRYILDLIEDGNLLSHVPGLPLFSFLRWSDQGRHIPT